MGKNHIILQNVRLFLCRSIISRKDLTRFFTILPHCRAQRTGKNMVCFFGLKFGPHFLTYEINNDNGVVTVVLRRLLGIVPGLVQQEGRHVGGEDGRVDHEKQDHPIPESLERRVVQHRPLVNPGRRLQPVLRHHLVPQAEDLQPDQGRRRVKSERVKEAVEAARPPKSILDACYYNYC